MGPLKTFLPTGQTPRLLYQRLRENRDSWKKSLIPIQIDEFISSERLFYTQLQSELIGPLNLNDAALCIDPSQSDVAFFDHVQRVLDIGPHLAILGLGPNGHVGFHEPGVGDHTFLGGRVKVSEETRIRVSSNAPSQAFTFGVGSFLKAPSVLLLVTGNSKTQILKKFLNSIETPELPASFLKSHKDITLITDSLGSN